MFLTIKNVLDATEIARLVALSSELRFVDGRASNPANVTKQNQQADPTDAKYAESVQILQAALSRARLRFSAKFYLIAMFFVIFDIEALFLYAWAVSVRESGWPGFIEALIFILVLLAGLIYVWRVGALDWSPAARRRRLGQP